MQIGSVVHQLSVVNVHGPNGSNSRFFATLGSLISGIGDLRCLIISGDFNSQLGSRMLTVEEQGLIGKFVGHENFNENGQQMRFFLNIHSCCKEH